MLVGAKKLALAAIREGFQVPENPVQRFMELSRLRQLLLDLRINCVLDVGANTGQFAREMRAIGYREYILSFEPLRAEFQALEASLCGDVKWQGFNFALGSEETMATINVIPDMTVMSSLLQPIGQRSDLVTQQITVKRLDGVLGGALARISQPRIFLKMDTQGYDLRVFRGLGKYVDDILAMQSEVSMSPLYEGMPHYLEALSVYESAGFRLHDLTLVSRTSRGSVQEMNCFMIKPHAA